jgi:hypothetical protein
VSKTAFGRQAPVGVVVVSLFVWATGVAGMIHIVQALWRAATNPDYLTGIGGYAVFFTAVAIAFAVNLVIISLSSALTSGSRGARIIISISIVIHAILSILTILSSQGDGVTLAAGWFALMLNVLALGALWITGRDFFSRSTASA